MMGRGGGGGGGGGEGGGGRNLPNIAHCLEGSVLRKVQPYHIYKNLSSYVVA